VVKHRIHSMMIPIPVFLDGEFKTVRVLDESGKALEEEVEFPDVGTYRVYAYPHPETITFSKSIVQLLRVILARKNGIITIGFLRMPQT